MEGGGEGWREGGVTIDPDIGCQVDILFLYASTFRLIKIVSGRHDAFRVRVEFFAPRVD